MDNSTPILLIHGIKDFLIPFDNSLRIYQSLNLQRHGADLKKLQINARQDCDHHNYYVYNDVVLPTMTFCNEIGLLHRDMGLSRMDLLYEMDTNSDDIFASVPYVYEKVDDSQLSDCSKQ